MASKRTSQEEGNDGIDRQVPVKRRHGDLEQEETSNTMNEQWVNDFTSLFRRVIREEIPPILQRHLSPRYELSFKQQSDTSRGRALQLFFMNQLPKTIFTLSKIIAEDGAPLQIELCDATYRHRIVNEEGSSMKVKVCVLNGDFGENCTAEEFNAKTLSPRERKGPLLIGDTVITLKNGVGCITQKVVFSDNSSWTRNGMFRLGVKVVQSTFIGADIREGISEPFKVKDNRGEGYKKHDCPSLNDEVWRLNRIRKDGKIHKQLFSNRINTVKDLLRLYITNQASLKEIIGNIPRKPWDTIIEHAKACDIDDDERYFYHCLAAEQSVSLVFNCIYEVVEVSFNWSNFRSLETLNLDEKLKLESDHKALLSLQRLVEIVKQQAYINVKDMMLLETTPHGLVKTLVGVQPVQHSSLDQALEHFDFPIGQQGQQETWQNMCEPSTSTSHIDEATHSDQLGYDQPTESGEMPINWLPEGPLITTGTAYNNDANIDQFPICFSPLVLTPWEQEVNFLYPPNGDGAESSNHASFPNTSVYILSKGKRRTLWHKIRYAFKWVILHLSKKRKAKLFHPQY